MYFFVWPHHVTYRILGAWPGIRPMPPALRATSKVPLKRQAVGLFLNKFFQSCHVPCVWLSRGTVVKGLPANAGNVGSIPGSRDSPESAEENGTRSSSSSSLRNSMDRVAPRVQSMGSQRVRHHRAMEHTCAFYTSALFHLWVNQVVYMWRVFCIHFTLFKPPSVHSTPVSKIKTNSDPDTQSPLLTFRLKGG